MSGASMPDATIQGGGFCGVCGEQNLAKNCAECDMQFCLECDERWHCHKLRRNHVRTSLLAAKDNAADEKRRRPVPVPRQRKSQKAEDSNLRNSQNFQDPTASNVNYVAFEHHSPSGNQEIKRPPSQTGTSRDNMTSHMTSPGKMTSPGNMNIHVNPSQQHQRLNAMYGAYAPQTGSPYSGQNQGFDQSGNRAQDFNQSGNRAQDFNQSGSKPQDSHQSADGVQTNERPPNTRQNLIRKQVPGLQDLEDSGAQSAGLDHAYEAVKNKNVSFERRVGVLFAEQQMPSWGRAETTVKLLDMGFNLEDCIEAAKAYGDLERSLGYLQQECPVCYDQKPMSQMITFLSCQDKICKNCMREYLKIRIEEMQIHQIVCPVCGLPDLSDEVAAALYFNNLDIFMRGLVDRETHDLFHKKLRDRALRKEPNFRRCAHCSYGFINDFPNINKMQCPHCQKFTCFSCKKPWEDQHEGISCEQFVRWTEENDEEYQLVGLAGRLARNGIGSNRPMASSNLQATGACGAGTQQGAVYMTPKNRPLEEGIYMSPNEGDVPPLPAKKEHDNYYSPRGKILDAQKHREPQLSEKEKAKLFDEEKRDLHNKGLITEDEMYTIDSPDQLNQLVEARKRTRNLDPNKGYPIPGYPGQAGYPVSWYPGQAGYPAANPGDDLNQQQLMQLLESGVITEQDVINNEKAQRNVNMNRQVYLDAQKHREQQLSEKERGKLFDEKKRDLHNKGLITEDEMYTIDSPEELNQLVEARKRTRNLDPNKGYPDPNNGYPIPGYPGQAGYPAANPGDDLNQQQLMQLLQSGVIIEQDVIKNEKAQRNINMNRQTNERPPNTRQNLIRKQVPGLQDLEDSGAQSAGLDHAYEAVKNKNVSFERRVGVLFAEQQMPSWGRAETTVKLLDMGFNLEDCIEAAKAYGDLERSLGYLQQECPVCYDQKPMSQMITFLSCQDKICKNCMREYLKIRIEEMQIHQIVCPVCGLPDLSDEVAAALYFNNLDIFMRGLVDRETHDLFHKKLRDRALRKEPNFRRCAHCSYGFINDFPNVNKMQCPHCQKFTCFSCKKPWEDQHEGISCEQFVRWTEENDEEYQLVGLAGRLARNGIGSNRPMASSNLQATGACGAGTQQGAVYMTPKNRPLEGGIYMSPNEGDVPPLPAKKEHDNYYSPRGKILDAQKHREQQLLEKEKAKLFDEEKRDLHNKGLITEDEMYTIDSPDQLNQLVEARKRTRNLDPNKGYPIPGYPGQAGYPVSGYPGQAGYPAANPGDDLNQQQLMQLLESGVITEQDVINNEKAQRNVNMNRQVYLDAQKHREQQLSEKERGKLFDEKKRDLLNKGLITADELYTIDSPEELNQLVKARKRTRDLDPNKGYPDPIKGYPIPGYPGQAGYPAANPGDDLNQQQLKQLLESGVITEQDVINNENAQRNINMNGQVYLDAQKQGEQQLSEKERGKLFDEKKLDLLNKGLITADEMYTIDSPEELNQLVKARKRTRDLNPNKGYPDPNKGYPIPGYPGEAGYPVSGYPGQAGYPAANPGDDLNQQQLMQLLQSGVIIEQDAIKNEKAQRNINMNRQTNERPPNTRQNLIRKQVPGLQDLEDSGAQSAGLDHAYEAMKNKNVSFERRIGVLLAEQQMPSWGSAETAVKLLDMGFNLEDCIEAAKAYGDLKRSLGYLQQECPVCYDQKPMSQMTTFLSCQDNICNDCVAHHLTTRVKEMQIHQIVCPVCGLPDLCDEAAAALYFNNLDIMMRGLVDSETHDLFQKKLRDRALRKEPNFRWCVHCSYGFINDFPNINKMQCPDCQKFTCFSCKKPWEDQHEGISCKQFARWKEENDEEYQRAGLAGHLARNGIDCPECKFRYDLARGGCMHFKCGQCGHEFCSGCYNPFKHGGGCNVSPDCARRGIHAHHPRYCLFFLRDWEPEILQELLQENGVDYKAGARGLPVQDDEEIAGAVGGGQQCKVMLQKDPGMEDVECGIVCQPGHDGLCKKHYTEYLVDLINKNGIDPVDKMTIDEMHVVFRRSEIQPPARVGLEGDDDYRQRLLGVLKQQIPLPRPPGLQAAAVEVQGEEE